MKFPQALESGRLLTRYKRFLADVELDSGAIITAACPIAARLQPAGEPRLAKRF